MGRFDRMVMELQCKWARRREATGIHQITSTTRTMRWLVGLLLVAVVVLAATPDPTLIPPRGWNPCNGFNCNMANIGEDVLKVRSAALG